MKEKRLFYSPYLQEGLLPQDEANHLVKVLHLKPGDVIWLTDGQGNMGEAELISVNSKQCTYQLLETTSTPQKEKGIIHLAIAPTKNIDRIEWLVEKAVEIGIDRISFLHCDYAVRKTIRLDRIEKIAIAAMKQSHKAFLPQIDELQDFTTFITQINTDNKFIAHCYQDDYLLGKQGKPHLFDIASAQENAVVLVGPEGDFSVEEVQKALALQYIPVNLGESRLRTETAGLCAIEILNLKNREKSR